MVLLIDEIFQSLLTALGPFLRASALFYAAPVFSARAMPVPVRTLLAAAIALLITPFIESSAAFIDPFTAHGLLIAFQELIVGAMMGFALALAFSVLSQVGENIALGMGLGFASINDPNNGLSVPVVAQLYGIIGTLVFLALGGHGLMIEALNASFRSLPLGFDGLDPQSFGRLAWWGAEMYGFAILLALPAVATLLMINLAFGVITRTAPQLNLFAIGFPIMIFSGLGIVVLSLPAVIDGFIEVLAEVFRLIEAIL